MSKVKTLAIFNFLMYLIAFSVSSLSQLKFFNNQTNGQISAKYEALFTPSAITFSIWGLIFISLFVFVIYHLIIAFKEGVDFESNQELLKLSYLFIINNIAVILWVFAFSFEYIGVSVLCMLIQLLTLTFAVVKLEIYSPHKSISSRLFTQFPLSIYFAWICVATMANISVYLVSINWTGGGLSATTWTAILIWLAVGLSVYMDIQKKNAYFGIVVMWAMYGIYKKLHAIDASFYRELIITTWVALAIIGLTVLIRFIINFLNRSFDEDVKS